MMRSHGTDEQKNKFKPSEKNLLDMTEGRRIKRLEKINKYNENPKKCLYCKNIISYEEKVKKFCNNVCSAKYNNPKKEPKPRIRKSQANPNIWGPVCRIYPRICLKSNELFIARGPTQRTSNKCKTDKQKYYDDCKFTFNFFHYKKEFDLDLINQFGIYTTPGSNKKGLYNPNGISRDHKISINYGWENNISPKIISHPANCQLMQHKTNKRKHTNNSITLEELLINIEIWDSKYK